MILYGVNDKGIGTTALKHLKNLPNNEIHKLSDAGHACYMNNPKDFHHQLVFFAKRIYDIEEEWFKDAEMTTNMFKQNDPLERDH